MAGILDLTPGAPRITGLRERDYTLASLHGDHTQQQPKGKAPRPSPSINASPRGSSSDEDLAWQKIPDDAASDDSEFGRIERMRKSGGDDMLGMGMDLSSAKAELSVEPSNIRASSFTSGKGDRSRHGSQSSKKRLRVDLDDDDDMPLSFSQQKRPRHSYGNGSTNPHRGPATKPDNPKKMLFNESEKARSAFREPATRISAMQARADKLNSASAEMKTPGRRDAPSTQTSLRSQRALQRSVKGTQESSRNSSKDFKQPLQPSPKKLPPRPSPRKVPKFRAIPMVHEETEPPRATTCSAATMKPSVLAEADALKSFELQNALNTVTNKLGISERQFDLPPSGPRDSSAHPTSFDAATTVSSPLSSLDDSTPGSSQDVPIITSEDLPNFEAKPRPAACPMCKQPVDQSYLEQFTEVGKRMSLRQQSQFCKAHKGRTAESEWAERKYPKIDWHHMDARIVKLHGFMDDILSRRKSSFYRNVFEDSLKSGKSKTIQERLMGGDEIEGMSPGYYGGRGAKLMADNIMSRFARKIRRLAASDKLISSGGVSRYVQAVLVPELAVLLVMDDMNVDEEKAREILRDSVDIGNLLNEEEDEIITDPAPEERVEMSGMDMG